MILQNLSDFKNKTIQDTIQNLNKNFGFNLIAVFDIATQSLINIYIVHNFVVQDEQNRKTFMIRGKVLNLEFIIQKVNWQYSIKEDIEHLPDCSVTYSENMFGFIGYGITGY